MDNLLDSSSCSLNVEHRESYLYAVASGKRENSETCREILRHILTESKSKNHNKILYERRIEGIGSVSEIRELIEEMSAFVEDEYVAYVDVNKEHFQTNRLAEMIASNLDLNVKFCTSLGEAKEWLLLK